jgi:dihydroorotate dehydrogenase (fumarate)
VDTSLAATTGVHTWQEVVKLLLAGADVTMMASAMFKHGPGHLTTVMDGIRTWLDEHEYESVEQAKGSVSQAACPDPVAFERSNYMRAVVNYTSPYGWRAASSEPRA